MARPYAYRSSESWGIVAVLFSVFCVIAYAVRLVFLPVLPGVWVIEVTLLLILNVLMHATSSIIRAIHYLSPPD